MLWLKGCPRCHGDLYAERDLYGEFKSCLQCGFSEEMPRTRSGARPTEKASVRRSAVA